jgi:hypothetical protein
VPLHRSRDLLILQAGRRLTEVSPPLVSRAEELGRDAGKTAAWVFDGNTPGEAYQRVRRGIDEGDPAVLDAIEPSAIGPGAGYDQDDLARDLGIEPGDRALPRVVSATPTPSPAPSGRKASGPPATTPARRRARPTSITRPSEKAAPGKGKPARKRIRQYSDAPRR